MWILDCGFQLQYSQPHRPFWHHAFDVEKDLIVGREKEIAGCGLTTLPCLYFKDFSKWKIKRTFAKSKKGN
jgi:hypothetical protein